MSGGEALRFRLGSVPPVEVEVGGDAEDEKSAVKVEDILGFCQCL